MRNYLARGEGGGSQKYNSIPVRRAIKDFMIKRRSTRENRRAQRRKCAYRLAFDNEMKSFVYTRTLVYARSFILKFRYNVDRNIEMFAVRV